MGLFKKKSTQEDHPAMRETQASEDSSLPGTAGYRDRRTGDEMPGGFTFVRPDGRSEEPKKKSWLRGG